MDSSTQPGTTTEVEYLEPLTDNIVIEPEPAETTRGSIALSDKAKTKPKRGKVLAVGPGRFDEKMVLFPGDTVAFEQNMGIEIEIGRKKLLVIKQSQLLCRIKQHE